VIRVIKCYFRNAFIFICQLSGYARNTERCYGSLAPASANTVMKFVCPRGQTCASVKKVTITLLRQVLLQLISLFLCVTIQSVMLQLIRVGSVNNNSMKKGNSP
jgi:hypothetical protein